MADRRSENLGDAFGDVASHDVGELAEIVDLLAEEEALADPPGHLWNDIEARIAADRADGSDGATTAPTRPARWLVAAAVLAVLAGLLAVGLLLREDEGSTPVVALEPQPGHGQAVGTAELGTEDDERVLRVDVGGVEVPAGAELELWLLDLDEGQTVSLGTFEGSAEVVLAEGIDLDDTPVVDVSVEPLDGDPGHSGDSVVRGTIES